MIDNVLYGRSCNSGPVWPNITVFSQPSASVSLDVTVVKEVIRRFILLNVYP